jgi:hypothetical protein
MQTKNVGKCDRLARVIVGVALALLAYYKLDGVWQLVAYVVAIIAIITAAMRFCPVYVALGGIDSTKCSCKMCGSCKIEDKKKEEK